MNQAERLVRQGGRHELGLAATYRRGWEAACVNSMIERWYYIYEQVYQGHSETVAFLEGALAVLPLPNEEPV